MSTEIEKSSSFVVPQSVADNISKLVADAKLVKQVSNDNEARVASSVRDGVKGMIKEIATERKAFTSKLDAVKKEAMRREATLTEQLVAESDRLNQLVGVYVFSKNQLLEKEERRKAAEEEAKAQEEAEKAEAEARKAAALSRLTGKKMEVVEPPVAPVVIEQEKKRPIVSGVKTRETWTFTIVDAGLVPREYCKPDEVVIRKYVQSMKDAGAPIENLHVEGVEFKKQLSVY